MELLAMSLLCQLVLTPLGSGRLWRSCCQWQDDT